MAIVTVEDSPSKPLQLESIPLVDLRLLSQSELNSLSLCSKESFGLHRCDDIVIPKIDRSVFNESAGSRKQTYSRLHFAPPESDITNIGRNRRFSSGLLPVSKHPTNKNPIDDPERKENQRIVTLLRELFAKDNPGTDLVPFCSQTEELVVPEPLNVENGFVIEEFEENERKRKRGRKRKDNLNSNRNRKEKLRDQCKAMVTWNTQNMAMEIVNRNGEVVDITALGTLIDPFGPELRRRTVGLETESELLGFLGGLEGQWGSTRKKRKFVDAGDFGDYLPKGWKILLSLKRKGGRVWLNCRRYISPSGQQLISMKEVSSYLHSIFGTQDTNEPDPHYSAEICGANNLASGSIAGLPHRDEKTREDLSYHQASPHAPLSTERENQVTSMRVDNLAEVEVKDFLICRKCNTSYNEKDAYLQHLLTSHQSKNKSRLCSTISDGVIINDGKYECQFCHKIFQEKHRYNGHVGNHVKSYVKRLDATPGKIIVPKSIHPSSLSEGPSVICKVDELVDADKGSTIQTSAKPNDEPVVDSPHRIPLADSVSGTLNANPNFDEMSVDAACGTPVTDSGSGTFNATSAYDEMNVEASPSMPVTDSVSGTSKAKSNNDEMNVEASLSTPVVDSVPGTSSDKPNYDEMSVKAPQSTLVMDSVSGTSNAKSNFDELSVKAPCSTHVTDSVSGTFNAKSDYEEMNVEAPRSTLVMDSVSGTSNAKSNFDEMSVKAPCSTPVTDSVSGTFNTKSDYEEMNVEAPQSTPAMDSSTFKPNDGSPHCKLDADSIPETSAPKFNWELHLASPYNKQDRGADKIGESLADESCDKQYGGYEITDDKLGEIHESNNNLFGTFNSSLYSGSILSSEGNGASKTSNGEYVFGSTNSEIDKYGLEQEAGFGSCWLTLSIGQINEAGTSVSEGFSLYPNVSQLCEAKESDSHAPESCFGTRDSGPAKNILPETIGSTDEGNLLETMVADTPMELMKSSNFFPTFNMISDKGENDFQTVDQKLEKVSDFEELKLDDMDSSKFSFLMEQESNPLQEQSLDLTFDAVLGHGLGTSVQFDWDSILPNMESRQQQSITTVCVWCGLGFNLDTVDPAAETGSVGYMCPTCKARISGQLKFI